jgi:hypothetical protein
MRRVHSSDVHDGRGAAMVFGITCATGLSSVVVGQTIMLSAQQRRVNAMVIVPPCGAPTTVGDNESATDFGPFSGKVEASRICDFAHGIARAQQHSSINAASLAAEASASSQVFSVNPSVLHAIPWTTFDVTFQTFMPVRYFIDGEMSAQAGLPVVISYSRVTLSDASSQMLVNLQVNPGPGGSPNTLEVQETGTLAPGQYRLVLYATSAVDAMVPPAGTGQAAFDMLARFQRPGDADVNGVVDADDLIAVILSWGPCPAPCMADLDQNGFVDADDLTTVILNWS